MKVAIAGYGLEGESNYRYWTDKSADVTIFDENENPGRPIPDGAATRLGKDVFKDMNGYDLVVRTAGLDPSRIKTDGKIWSATQEFFARVQAPIIGVTGTKGKGTTASFIKEILSSAGHNVHLLGNVGIPALDVLQKINHDDLVVYELSSFQLWDLERSPHVAVVLMIEPDHLDVHHSMDDYVMAKANIARWQKPTDTVVFYPKNEFSRTISSMSPGRQLPYTASPGCRINDDHFEIDEERICSTAAVQLPGAHNLENACAAITAAWQFTHDVGAIERGLKSFKGLPHRLKLVKEINGVRYYDDSIATTPGSAIAAIQAFDSPKILILGGSDKGADFKGLGNAVAHSKNLKAVITIGQTGESIAGLMRDNGVENVVDLGQGTDMDKIVETARQLAEDGDVVIMSPACASFDMFNSYTDRGEQFVKAVESL